MDGQTDNNHDDSSTTKYGRLIWLKNHVFTSQVTQPMWPHTLMLQRN